MREMGSRYLFIVLYVWLEHTLSRGDYRVSPPPKTPRARRGALDLSRERAVMLGLWSAAALACILGVLAPRPWDFYYQGQIWPQVMDLVRFLSRRRSSSPCCSGRGSSSGS